MGADASWADDWPVLSASEWGTLQRTHAERAESLLAGVRERRQRSEKHPVEDFLFEYYNLRPTQVATWLPGLGRRLADADHLAGLRDHALVRGLVMVDAATFARRRLETLRWVHHLLTVTAARPAHVGCFGMHEWAMVHGLRPGETRHPYLPLRFEAGRIRDIVDEVGLRCSHYDAFRFFTPDARPLNRLQLTRADQEHHDQPGCLHVTMDLYKWAGKLLPLVPGEVLLDAFELARDVRELDMRASAYDLSGWGYPPVPVETPAGRAEYARAQRGFAERGGVIRQELLAVTSAAVELVHAV